MSRWRALVIMEFVVVADNEEEAQDAAVGMALDLGVRGSFSVHAEPLEGES